MSVHLHSYITLDGTAKEAAEFYRSVFGGKVEMDTFGKYAEQMPVAPGDEDKVMHASLKGDNGIELMLSDTPSGMQHQAGPQTTLALSGDDETTLRDYFDKLSQGGSVTMPLDKSPWGDIFGMVTDKFGVIWMVDIGPVQ